MAVILVITESGLMHGADESNLKSYVRVPSLSLRAAIKAIKEQYPGYIDHNRFIVPVQVPQEPKLVAEEIDHLLHHAMDPGEHQKVHAPVSAMTAADRFDG